MRRADIISQYGITKPQLEELEKTRAEIHDRLERDIQQLKREAILTVFESLNKQQRDTFLSLAGYRIPVLAQYFSDVFRERFDRVMELEVSTDYVDPLGRDEILASIGPIRFLLSPCISERDGLSEKEIELLRTNSTRRFRQLQWEIRDVYSAAYEQTLRY